MKHTRARAARAAAAAATTTATATTATTTTTTATATIATTGNPTRAPHRHRRCHRRGARVAHHHRAFVRRVHLHAHARVRKLLAPPPERRARHRVPRGAVVRPYHALERGRERRAAAGALERGAGPEPPRGRGGGGGRGRTIGDGGGGDAPAAAEAGSGGGGRHATHSQPSPGIDSRPSHRTCATDRQCGPPSHVSMRASSPAEPQT